MDDPYTPSEQGEAERSRYRVKAELRAQMRTLRSNLPLAACKTRASAICNGVVQLPCFERARTVIGYMAILKEVDPASILQIAREQGKSIGLPRVDMQNQVLSIHQWSKGDPLEKSPFGVMEPYASAPEIKPLEIDLVLVPALAIDPRGYRIGYGKGFYDRFLALLSDAKAVGIAYDFQLIIESPATKGDLPVSVVVTDRRTLFVDRIEQS
jgi:5-formyltetrahydrofolate cyclo-ligase